MSTNTPSIEKGQILVYRVFDIAEEVDLGQVERLLSEGTARLGLTRSRRKPIVLKNAPVTLTLGEQMVPLLGREMKSELQAKIWDYGVLSISFSIPIPGGATPADLLALSSAVEDSLDLDEIAQKRAQEMTKALAPALQRAHLWETFEDYVIFFIEKIAGVTAPAESLGALRVPELLLAEEKETLSAGTRDLVMESILQYSDQDLVVIDWNSALVIEPSGMRDIPDVIEFAVTQLMEMRFYDELLDRRLTNLYDNIEVRKKSIWRNTFATLSREASMRYVEISEFIERVENSLKVVGDFYLATVFRHATRQLRIESWQASITRKMGILAQVSEILQGEVNVTRSLWLEAIIVGLILFEILTAVYK